jgi:beta-fructofuranosidase
VEVAATRGVAEGVSEKSNAPALLGGGGAYDWTNAMLSWQRTAFHFQPEKNWMNGRYVAIAILSSSILFN